MKLLDLKLTSDYLALDELFYHEVLPQPLNNPHLLHVNRDVAKLIGIDEDELGTKEFVEFINGKPLPNSKPYAMCYAGHQFGFFVDRLGDGRAINLGEVNGWKLQIKGAGTTRYSRSGDGRAVLRSSLREYLMSEAMHGLGIATTRALAIIGSTTHKVRREEWEKGSIVLRVSSTWTRFGSFEYFSHSGKHQHLEALMDFTIKESFPHLLDDRDAYIKMFSEVVETTAIMIAKWMAVGFNHGVMNTDNMSITGLTIDYGPYAFLDEYDVGYICNHTDREGRYSFGNQPQIGHWNLSALMQALAPLINIDTMQEVLKNYEEVFNRTNLEILRGKLGLEIAHEKDPQLISSLFEILQEQRIDYTPFFRTLSNYTGDREEILSCALLKRPLDEWLDIYDVRLTHENKTATQRVEKMKRVNPKYVLKNYMLQEAIDKAKEGDFSVVDDLMILAKDPFDEHPTLEGYAKTTPIEHKNLKLSCSS